MQQYSFSDLLAHGKNGVERGHGILKNHGDFITANVAHFSFTNLGDFFSVQKNAAALYLTDPVGKEAKDAQRSRGFTGAGLTDQSERLALF